MGGCVLQQRPVKVVKEPVIEVEDEEEEEEQIFEYDYEAMKSTSEVVNTSLSNMLEL